MGLSTVALLAFALAAQTPVQPAADLSLHSSRLPGIEIRFVDFHWQPALFEAMEKGGSTIPEAKRNWVLARVITEVPLTLGGTKVAVGNYALALWPNLDGKGMAIELRSVDMREVYPNVNAMAPAPQGETVYKAPAKFDPMSPIAPRLDLALADKAGKVALTIRYGNRSLALTFVR
jgi:hypothetical protein